MKKILAITLSILVLILTVTSCSLKQDKTTESKMSKEEMIEKYVSPVLSSGLLYKNFSENNYNEIKDTVLMYLFMKSAYDGYEKETGEYIKEENYYLVSFDDIKKEISKYLNISDDELKQGLKGFKDKKSENYICYANTVRYTTVWGAKARIEKYENTDDKLVLDLRYTNQSRNHKKGKSQLTIKKEKDGSFKYLSNEITEKDSEDGIVFPLMTAKQQEMYHKYISPVEISYINWLSFTQDNYSEVYQECFTTLLAHLVLSEYGGTIGTPLEDEDAYVFKFEEIKEVISKYLIISDDVLKEKFKSLYSEEHKGYKVVFGLGGGTIPLTVDRWEQKENVLTLYLSKYEHDEWTCTPEGKDYAHVIAQSVLKIRLEDDGGFKYLSNEVTNLYD